MTIYTFGGDAAEFDAVRKAAEQAYSVIGAIVCPYFSGEKIVFNAKGLRHLKFKSDSKARPRKDQYARLKLLRYAPEVIRLSRTVQGVLQTRQFELQKTNSRWERVLKDVTYYEFVAVFEAVRVRIIVKQVDQGEKYFWSLILSWDLDPDARRRVLINGDPRTD
jgi:hypothetical protein